jgi:hypothetical protein
VCYAEVEDVPANGMVKDRGIERGDMLFMLWVGRSAAKGFG